MRTLISGSVKFFMLDAGELYPDPHNDNRYVGAYVIFPYEGQWLAQRHENNRWVHFTTDRFDTENEAFNFAYAHHLAAQHKLQANCKKK